MGNTKMAKGSLELKERILAYVIEHQPSIDNKTHILS